MSRVDEIAARAAAATLGPWGWFGHRDHGMYLSTVYHGRIYVMDFIRQGMQGAQPRFQVHENPEHPDWGTMTPASELAVLEVAPRDYRDDIVGIDHPDAAFIAAARDDVPWLLAEVERLRARLEQMRTYARHDPFCNYSPTYPDAPVATCDCGFDAALAAQPEETS